MGNTRYGGGEPFKAYRAGAEGIAMFALSERRMRHIDRPTRRGRCEQFLLCQVSSEPFLQGSARDAYIAGRALSYLYAYLDFLGCHELAAHELTNAILREIARDKPPLARAIFGGFRAWLEANGMSEVRDGRVTFEEGYFIYVDGADDPGLDVTSPISMHPRHSFEKIQTDLGRLLQLLEGADTRQLLWLSLYPSLHLPEGALFEVNLSAAYKTSEYLRALILQTNAGERQLMGEEVLELYTTLERMVSFYRDLPSWRGISDPKVGFTVASALLANALSAPMISIEQERARILELFSLYAAETVAEFGADAATLDRTINGIVALVKRKGDALAPRVRQAVSLVPKSSYWDRVSSFGRRMFGQSEREPVPDYGSLLEPFLFSFDEVCRSPWVDHAVLKSLSARRGMRLEYKYFAGETKAPNPGAEHPIIEMSDGVYFLPMANPLFHAAHTRGMRAISINNSNTGRRDRYLESKVAAVFRRLFPTAPLYCTYEPLGFPGEQDLFVPVGRALLLVESKAGRAPLALRDPAPSFKRLESCTRDREGPFYGIGQAQRIIRRLKSGESVTLRARGDKVTLDPSDFDEYFAVCITLFDWAALVINWDLLEAVDVATGHPWAVDYDRLEAFSVAILLRGWDGDDFLQYLRERIDVHGKIITFDELDYAANFIYDGDLRSLTCTPNTYSFRSRGPAVLFDELEMAYRQRSSVRLLDCERPSVRDR